MIHAWSVLLQARIPPGFWWVLGPVVLWRSGLRVYRLVARQPFSEKKSWWRGVSLLLLTALVALITVEARAAFYSLLLGLAAGAALAVIGIRLSSLRIKRDSAWLRPDPLTGIVLSLLLAGRIVWRLVEGSPSEATGWTLEEFVSNSSTMFLFGLFSAQYAVYSFGLAFTARRRGRPSAPR